MIPLATQTEQVPVLDKFPEGLEYDNKQSDESDDTLTEQIEEKAKD